MYKAVCVCGGGGGVSRFWSYLIETILFHFHRIFKHGAGKGCSSEPLEPPLDPPLFNQQKKTAHHAKN